MKLVFGKYSGFDAKEFFLKDSRQLVGEIEKVPVSLRRFKCRLKIILPSQEGTFKISVGDYSSTAEAERVAKDLFKSKEKIFDLIELQRAQMIEATQNLFK